MRDVALDIYEYKEYTPPKRGKKLQMNIPIIGDSISVEFDDLLHNYTPNWEGVWKAWPLDNLTSDTEAKRLTKKGKGRSVPFKATKSR